MQKVRNWEQKKLEDVAFFINGGAWNANEYVPSGIPVVRVTDCQNGSVDMSACRYLPKSSYTKYRKHEIHEGDLVVATVGSHPTQPGSVVGRPIVIPREANGGLLNQNAVCIRPLDKSILDKQFLSHFAKAPSFGTYIISCARGSANQVRMAIGLLKEMPIKLPPLPVQRKIAAILSAYDDLIENNLRRIKILEEMAQNLYREWFVKFRFPGHQHARFVDSPLGRIPEGWEVVPFTEIADVLSGGTPKTSVPEYWGGQIPFFAPKDAPNLFYITDTEKSITELGLKKCNSRLYPKDTVFITARGTVGKVVMPSENMAMNQSCYALKGKEGVSQLYLFLATKRQTEYLKRNTGGATFDTIVVDTFRLMKITKPHVDVIDLFSKNVQPLFELLLNAINKNRSLRSTRDLLLPKLISGEVDVSELDITVPEEVA